MARENLFDGRYRYDHIYPRGRSGEALRAYDTQDGDRPVVIKRPASQDAPPIRAGQEVNIRTERRALQLLGGHPVLTRLLGEGTYRVGGQAHLYIVMERAEGAIIEQEVLALAKQNARLPELEMLVILDRLLDLLEAAHAHEIVYNDVDAKHLFWDRDRYALQVIDWGNAVFLEGDEVTPGGISRQTDVFQAGELLYFIVTGGQRIAFSGEYVDFGKLPAGSITTRLQGIVQRAAHPDPARRYPTIRALRDDLADYRRPIERDRDTMLERVEDRLRAQRSQAELERLLERVEKALMMDPGHPRARDLDARLRDELHRLSVHADLDAVRIYIEGENWGRAETLLQQVITQTGGAERGQALILLEAVSIAQESAGAPPAGLLPAVAALFEHGPAEAAYLLLTTPEGRPEAREQQWLLAERVQAHAPGVAVLRPHLLRLERHLDALDARYRIGKARQGAREAFAALEDAGRGRLLDVAACYRRAVEALEGLGEFLNGLERGRAAEAIAPALESAQRAAAAAGQAAAALERAAGQAIAHSADARDALKAAAAFDPVNPVWPALQATLHGLYDSLHHIEAFRPQPDGADLGRWFASTLADLTPYLEDVSDPQLRRLLRSVQMAARAWDDYAAAAIAGNRAGALAALTDTAEALRPLNRDLMQWFLNLRTVVEKSRYIQRHALNTALGRLLADGWSAWDRGSGIEAERLGRQALEEIGSDAEEDAVNRLIRLGHLLRNWKDGHGEGDPRLTQEIDDQVVALLTPEEARHWQTFTDQMPSAAAYLKAMGTGLVEYFEAHSTAAQRILFLHYVLRGVIEMFDLRPDDAEFWRAAAEHTLPNAKAHVAYLALTNVIRDRQTMAEMARVVNTITKPDELGPALAKIGASPLHLVLKPIAESITQVQHALPQWEAGQFRPAGEALQTALDKIEQGEALSHIQFTGFRTWVRGLYDATVELSLTRQRIEEGARNPTEEPDDHLLVWHQKLIDLTSSALEAKAARRFVVWRDMYTAMQEVYTHREKRRSRKLIDFDDLFNTPGVGAHPAYPLYVIWRDLVRAQEEFPAPPTDEPTPRYADDDAARGPAAPTRRRLMPRLVRPRLTRGRLRALASLGGMLLLAVVAVAVLRQGNPMPTIAVTISPTASPTQDEVVIAARTISAVQTETAAAVQAASATPSPTESLAAAPSPTRTRFPTTAPISGQPIEPDSTLAAPDEVTATPVAGGEVGAAATATPTFTLTASATPSPVPDTQDDALLTLQAIAAELTATSAALTAAAPAAATPTTSGPTVLEATPRPTREGDAHGTQDVLTALEAYVPAYPWPESWFSPGALSGGWRLGLSTPQPGESLLQITLPADVLDLMFGTEAAVRLRRVQATFTLLEYDPALLAQGRVYFGLGLQGANDSRVAAQAQFVRQDALNVGARVGDEFRARSQFPVTEPRVTLALERGPDGSVTLLLDGTAIGPSRFLTAPNAPVTPYVFVQQGGVVVAVSDFIAELD